MLAEADGGRVAAFFDLDRTLIDVNSGMLYARFERRLGRISRLQLWRTAAWMVLYHFSLSDMERAYARAVSFYAGVAEAELDRRTRTFFAAEIEGRLQPGARAAIERHRRLGHQLVVLTSSSTYLAAASSEAWGIDHWIATRFLVDGRGLLDGTLEPPLCYGAGKVERAEAWAAERGCDLATSYFYSDSLSDLPMLERVRRPRIVNPDPRLAREARRRGWPVLDWRGTPSDGRGR